MYVDTAYIAKYCLNEPETPAVRELIEASRAMHPSTWALTEVHCVFHRCLRERFISQEVAGELARREGWWTLIPAGEQLLRRAGALVIAAPPSVFLRTADAIHLTTAMDEIWTNDRHMLARPRTLV